MDKFKSRKFWVSIAAFLASISTSIAGYQLDDHKLAMVGIICGMLSMAIYAACEAYTDGKAVAANTTAKTEITTKKTDGTDNQNE